MIDIDTIKARHLDPEKNRGRTYYEGHIEVDLAACVAEIERLRADMDAVRAALGNGADESVWPPGLTVEEAVERLRAEVRADRAAVVAWLREVSERRFPRNEREQGIVFRISHEIERGEHRREGEK